MATAKPFPQRTFAECNAILTAPGQLFELEDKVIGGIKYRTYKNLPKSLKELWKSGVTNFKDKDYVVYEGERYTFGQADERVEVIMRMLYHEWGVRKGDKVAICARNLPEWVFTYWAIACLGAVAVTVNAWLTTDAMEHCITLCDCRVVFLDQERAHQLRNSLAKLEFAGAKQVVVFRPKKTFDMPKEFVSIKALVEKYQKGWEIPNVEIDPEDHATMLFTSGTTGLPKAVLGTQRQYLTNIFNCLTPPVRIILRRGELPPAPDPNAAQKAFMLTVPLFHATGNHSILAVSTFMGMKLVMCYKWDAKKVAKLIIDEKVTAAGGMPFMAIELIEEFAKQGGHVLEGLSYGGGPASVKLPENIKKTFPEVNPGQGYGLTEVSSAAVNTCGEDYVLRPTSTGQPCLVNDCKIVDVESGRELPRGQVGELWIKGPNRCLGYYKSEKATKEIFLDDGWFRSGDIAYMDEDDFIYIQDRAKDIIIRGGENIASVVVENALYLDPRVLDVAVVPLPDHKLGELVGASVVTKPDFHGKVTEKELLEVCAKNLPKHCIPAMIDIRTETFPRNGSGKTLKRELKLDLAKIWERRQNGKAKL
ncbi:AMP-dependent synthetase and ligase [Meredithblackwellia eburnea MCA 4105]